MRIVTYQWVTSDFRRNYFHTRFLVIKAARAAPVGRFAALSTPHALPDGKIFSEPRQGILSFDLSPVVHQSQSLAIMRSPRVSGKKLSAF